jgi:drug/metabolite transporter (DMT)-like permease
LGVFRVGGCLGLNAKHAALIQLSVPLLAATGGVFFLSEPLVLRIILSAVLIIAGIALAIAISGRSKGLPSGPKKPSIEPVVK